MRLPSLAHWSGPWRKITHAIGYWLLSLWLIFILALVADDLIDVYTDPDDYERIYASVFMYKATDWLYLVLLVVAVIAQARCVRRQRLSFLALTLAIVTAAIQTAIVVFRLNPACCT